MNKYIRAITEYFKSKAYYIYEDPITGEVFTYKRKGVYRKNGRILVFQKTVSSSEEDSK
tara:strand:- start:59 stop:235 length:177 start_codon:yes stop_codon:yes gene_type:complete